MQLIQGDLKNKRRKEQESTVHLCTFHSSMFRHRHFFYFLQVTKYQWNSIQKIVYKILLNWIQLTKPSSSYARLLHLIMQRYSSCTAFTYACCHLPLLSPMLLMLLYIFLFWAWLQFNGCDHESSSYTIVVTQNCWRLRRFILLTATCGFFLNLFILPYLALSSLFITLNFDFSK